MSIRRMHVDRRVIRLRSGGIVTVELRCPDALRMAASDRALVSSVVDYLDQYEDKNA